MASTDRDEKASLTLFERLIHAPGEFHFFYALRILENHFHQAPRIGYSSRPSEDPVRMEQEVELSFPPTTIREFIPPSQEAPGRLVNRFFGFFGPNGPLPIHITEYVRNRIHHHHDQTASVFINMLSHRMTCFLYRAWASGQPSCCFDRDEGDVVQGKIAAFSGFNAKFIKNADSMPEMSKRYFAGLLGQETKNAEGLKIILETFFKISVKILQFVGCWMQLEPDDRGQIGTSVLGKSASIGTRVWSRSTMFRIQAGPLTLKDFYRLLPGSSGFRTLASILHNYVGESLDWDLNLILYQKDVPPPLLGLGALLGMTTWIGDKKNKSGVADEMYAKASNPVRTSNVV